MNTRSQYVLALSLLPWISAGLSFAPQPVGSPAPLVHQDLGELPDVIGIGGGAGGFFEDESDYPLLEPGQPVDVRYSPLDDEYPTWRIDVPSDVTAMSLRTTGATDDLALYVTSYETSEPDFGYFDLTGPGVWLDEELMITVSDAFPLTPGDWYVTIAPGPASLQPDALTVLRAQLHLDYPEPARAELAPGELIDLVLRRESGMRAILGLPEGFEPDRRSSWRVEVYSPTSDVDLVVGPGDPSNTLNYPYDSASRVINYEEVTFRGRQAKNLAVHAFALQEMEAGDEVPVRLRLSEVIDGERPAPIVPAVTIPSASGDERGRALGATLALFGPLGNGSGTLISDTGYVLTNAHVALTAGPSSKPSEGPVIFAGFNRDPRKPAIPEFGLELVEAREDLDLALLRFRTTLDGEPLPGDQVYPSIARGDSTALELGAPLWALGFPMTGGGANMTSITLTRGICAGFSIEAEGLAIKTDAGVHSGISGGALLDESWRLIGVPASSITDSNMAGGIGFAIPLENLPAEWLERIETR